MSSKSHNPDPLDQLMVDAATQGLSHEDSAALSDALSHNAALQAEAEAYELAATAIELALAKPDTRESLPPSLRSKCIASAADTQQAAGTPSQPGLKLAGTASMDHKPANDRARSFVLTDGRAFGWYAAAAALIALLILVVQGPQKQRVEVERIVEVPAQTKPPTPLAVRYDTMRDQAGTVRAEWGFAGGDADPRYADAAGEVIWNSESQTGFMKLSGMPINDPTRIQYQLWIVDASRDTAIENTDRVDGGVFDITATGHVIVPIDAKLLAREAAVFAITAETPGGVVESKGPLQLVAVVQKG